MPALLDLFCGAGGAGVGYAVAGFSVTGVDLHPQPRYPLSFIQGDAMAFLRSEEVERFDVIHASPPCQHYSVASKSHNGNAGAHPDLVAEVRELLEATGKLYVIENVVGAPLKSPTLLCGTMFEGLRVTRHRLFETNFFVWGQNHPEHPLHYTRDKRKPHYGKLNEWDHFVMVNGGGNCSRAAAADAMGIDWPMTKDELNQAIPPAYTSYIGMHALSAYQREMHTSAAL